VRILTIAQFKVRTQVCEKDLFVWAFADLGHDLGVDFQLIKLTFSIRLVRLFLEELEEFVIVLASSWWWQGLAPAEILVIDAARDVDTFKIDLNAGLDDVILMHSSQWASIDNEWSSNEQQTRIQFLEEDDALSSMTTSEDDQYATWVKTRLEFTNLCLFRWSDTSRLPALPVFSRKENGAFANGNATSGTILFSSDLLNSVRMLLWDQCFGSHLQLPGPA